MIIDMFSVLRVDPDQLRAAAVDEGQVSAYVSSIGAARSMADAVGSMAGLESSAACQLAGSVLDDLAQTLGDELTAHSERLAIAADRYQQADEEFGRRLKRSVGV